jgi:hypothetical protein
MTAQVHIDSGGEGGAPIPSTLGGLLLRGYFRPESDMNYRGCATFQTTIRQGVSQMKGVRGLVVVFKDGRRREFKLKKETKWQFVFSLLKWIVYFYPDHEKIELMRGYEKQVQLRIR